MDKECEFCKTPTDDLYSSYRWINGHNPQICHKCFMEEDDD